MFAVLYAMRCDAQTEVKSRWSAVQFKNYSVVMRQMKLLKGGSGGRFYMSYANLSWSESVHCGSKAAEQFPDILHEVGQDGEYTTVLQTASRQSDTS